MMVKLLDCTLRDGGYLNDWNFGQKNILNIFERLTDAGVNVIEVGFIDERRPYDIEKCIFPDTNSIYKTFKKIRKRPEMVVGMIDYGTCNIKNIQKQKDQFLDGIRVIFKKSKAIEALEYCSKIKKLGYKVFAQLVSITSYSDTDLKKIIKIVNKVEPYAVSIVDTYGLLDKEKTLHYLKILNSLLKPSISIGFHAHNNFQLAFANSIEIISSKSTHDLIIDGTLNGMGKSAGNAPIELISKYLNDKHMGNYNIPLMLEAINESINEFKNKLIWGYQPFYFLCAKNEIHPNYLNYFLKINKLSSNKINKLLSMISYEKKLLYDEKYAKLIYEKFLKLNNDSLKIKKIKKDLMDKKILIIGPGKNVFLQQNIVKQFITKYNPIVISINYIPSSIQVDYLFVTNFTRYKEMINDLNGLSKKIKIIGLSCIEARIDKFYITLDYNLLVDKTARIEDNSFLMLLKFFDTIKIKEVYCAGFDGYEKNEINYINGLKSYDLSGDDIDDLNAHVKKMIENKFRIKVHFITYSLYNHSCLNNTEIA